MQIAGRISRRQIFFAGLAGAAMPKGARADESAATLTTRSWESLQSLYRTNDKARALGLKAKAIMVFPSIVKAGAMVGGMAGTGTLFMGDRASGFYRITAGSFGFQLGAQTFAYALFFMNDAALEQARKSNGWAVGSAPSLVIVDEGMAKSLNTLNISDDIYAFAYGQKGLMAGTGLEGSKISRYSPGP